MTANIGNIDRIARAVFGIALIILALTGTIGAWGWIGIIPLATAGIRICPLYSVFGWNTGAPKA